jgi:hypothetical protein
MELAPSMEPHCQGKVSQNPHRGFGHSCLTCRSHLGRRGQGGLPNPSESPMGHSRITVSQRCVDKLTESVERVTPAMEDANQEGMSSVFILLIVVIVVLDERRRETMDSVRVLGLCWIPQGWERKSQMYSVHRL